jgi:hypothetical protein
MMELLMAIAAFRQKVIPVVSVVQRRVARDANTRQAATLAMRASSSKAGLEKDGNRNTDDEKEWDENNEDWKEEEIGNPGQWVSAHGDTVNLAGAQSGDWKGE